MEYFEVEEARSKPGIKLVLTAGVPGPWSEAIKKVLEYKSIPYHAVIQRSGDANEALRAWTGVRNAPVIVHDDGKPLTGWADMISFAEKIVPSPALLPEDSAARALVFGIINELAGYWGFGWCRRLMTFKKMSANTPLGAEPDPVMTKLAADYEVSPQAWNAAPGRVAGILAMLSDRLLSQRAQGSPYLVGQSITAADIYWAAFSAQLDPLPAEMNPMPDVFRTLFTITDPDILAVANSILIEHRNHVFTTHLTLPLDF